MALRVGLVGAGLMGGHHARNLARLADAALVAVADPHPERARGLAEPVGAEVVADAGALLGRVDAVVIASPAPTHAILTRQCLEAGLHVLVEKPIATTLADARAAFALAEARGRVLQGGHLLRYHRGVREMLAFGLRPTRLEAARRMCTERGADVSALMELMVHDLDLVLQLVGASPVEARATGWGPRGREHEVEARLRFDTGATATLHASRVSDAPARRLGVWAEEGALMLDFAEPCALTVQLRGRPEARLELGGENPLLAQLSEFVDRCLGRAPPLNPRADLDLLRLALYLQETMEPGAGPRSGFDKH